MELQQYLRILRRYWRSVLATFFVVLALAAGFTLLQRPTYTADSSIFLTVDSGSTAGELSNGAAYAERTVTSYVQVATTAMVLQPVIDELGLDTTVQELSKKLTVTSPASTQIITVAASDGDANQAARLSGAVARTLLATVDELSPAGPDGRRLVSATVIDEATPPTTPSSPRPVTNLALGALLGLALGVGQALVRRTLDTRITTAQDLEQAAPHPLLASIGRRHTDPRHSDAESAHWATAEAYRRLRTNVGFVALGGERQRSMVITSSVRGEGKTETAVNLARVLAAAGESVLLVDADLRAPQVAQRMGLDGALGLSDVLTGRGTLEALTIEAAPGRLTVLPAGTVPPNPSELLGSDAMAHLLTTAERQYDYVLFDAPPLLPVTDSMVLSAQAGGAIVVARSGLVRRPQLEAAVDLLKQGDVTVLGLVLNDVVTGAPHQTYYGRDGYVHATTAAPDGKGSDEAQRVSEREGASAQSRVPSRLRARRAV